MGSTGTTTYLHRRRPIHHGLPTRTTTCTCGSGGIRVLQTDDGHGGWCRFAGAGNTSGVWNLDVDKVFKTRGSTVDGGQLKWAVDKSKRNVKVMSRQLEEGNPYSSSCSCTHH